MGNVVPLGRQEEIESLRNPAVREAVRLMKDALAVLDAGGAGYTAVACHLSLAIDRAEERPLPRSEAECQSMLDELIASAGALPGEKM